METIGLSSTIASWLAALAPSAQVAYRSVIGQWLDWCSENRIDPLQATRTQIELYGRWLHDVMGYSTRTQRYRLSIIRNYYRYAYEQGLIDTDPGERVRMPRLWGHADGTWLDKAQAQAFLRSADRSADRNAPALCRLLLLNGIRLGEALGLDIDDYTHSPPSVRLDRKGDWSQRVAIPQSTAHALDELTVRRVKGAIFRGKSGKRMYARQAEHLVGAIGESIGVKGITPHSLRRTFATLSRDAGVADRDIMASGGWSSPVMINYYDMGRRALSPTAVDTVEQYLAS